MQDKALWNGKQLLPGKGFEIFTERHPHFVQKVIQEYQKIESRTRGIRSREVYPFKQQFPNSPGVCGGGGGSDKIPVAE